jgi:hypothetical protein
MQLLIIITYNKYLKRDNSTLDVVSLTPIGVKRDGYPTCAEIRVCHPK